MFSVSLHVRRMAPALLLVVAGCSGEITQRSLPGTWRAKGSGTGTAFKIKSEDPNVKGSDALAAGKILSTTSLEIKDDAAFTLSYGGRTYAGSWKFDQEAGMVELDVKTVDGEPVDKTELFTAFLGIVDQKTGTIRLFPGSRKNYEELKQNKDKGADILNVRLHKD